MQFHLYGVVVGAAVVLGWSVAERLDPRVRGVGGRILLVSLLGARGYHVVTAWREYQDQLWRVLYLWEGGLSIWGGLLAGGLAWYWWSREERVLRAMLTALPLAQAVGRLANWASGEFGERVAGVPWWGAESLLNLGLFGLLWRGYHREWTGWRLAAWYCLGYGGGRLGLELSRGGEVSSMIMSAILLIGGLWLWRQ